ncbi:MAG: butyrate kinase [Bacteroidales bacterium]|nr:butyrate kinase [Bacteroidales bacterium]
MHFNYILAINPGSTSTKVAVYRGNKSLFLKTIRHSTSDLKPFRTVSDQFEFRKGLVFNEVIKNSIPLDEISVVIARGGLLNPIESGVYEVNERMIRDLKSGVMGEHASNLGGLIAADIARQLPNAKAYIADPVVVDELEDLARVSGHPDFNRVSIFHALNQKAIARTYAQSRGLRYEELNLIIAHLGGGISVGAHKKGKVIDVNNALDGDGPFSPERSGSLPAGQLAQLCFESGLTLCDVRKMITGEGGLMAYLGTKDAHRVEIMAGEGDAKAKLIQDAMAYQISKEIGSMATVLGGQVNAIILTGGIANNEYITNFIKDRVNFIAPVLVYPGEDEMRALALNGNLLIKGEIKPKEYTEENFVQGLKL